LRRTGEIYGYGRVITPASIALEEAKKIGGRTVIRREGIGVVAQAFDAQGNTFFKSPVCYCPVCAVVIGASRNEELAKKIRERLAGKRNTGKIKYEQGVENIYEMEDGKVFVSIKRGNEMLAERVLLHGLRHGESGGRCGLLTKRIRSTVQSLLQYMPFEALLGRKVSRLARKYRS